MIDIRQSTLPPETNARVTAVVAGQAIHLGVIVLHKGQRPVNDSWTMDLADAEDLVEQLARAIRRAR